MPLDFSLYFDVWPFGQVRFDRNKQYLQLENTTFVERKGCLVLAVSNSLLSRKTHAIPPKTQPNCGFPAFLRASWPLGSWQTIWHKQTMSSSCVVWVSVGCGCTVRYIACITTTVSRPKILPWIWRTFEGTFEGNLCPTTETNRPTLYIPYW